MQDVLLGLAANPALPERLFGRLVEIGDESVHLSLAHRPQLTDTQVRTLLARTDEELDTLITGGHVPWADVPRDRPWSLLAALAAGIAPDVTARQLAAHPDSEIRHALASRAESLPSDVIAVLARDPDPEVVQEVALWAVDLRPSIAEELAHHPHAVVRAEFAKNRHAPPALLASLLADGGRPSPARCDACHPRAEGCADHAPGVRRIRLAAATNPAVPPAGLAPFLDAEEAWAPDAIAERTDLPAPFPARLAAHPAAFVRMTLASNPSIGEPLLRQLADDPDPDVRRAVADNPAVPLDLLLAVVVPGRLPSEPLPRILAAPDTELYDLAASRVAQVRALVAARPDLPAPLVGRLVADPDVGVARRIAPHPGLTAEQLTDLVERHGPPVYGAVARNPGCPGALLRRMAGSADSVRRALRVIAAHPALPADVVEELLTDPEPRVVQASAAHPALPVATMERLLAEAAGN
ncbi:hypothetical protein [Streptomyces sp. NPDC054975]